MTEKPAVPAYIFRGHTGTIQALRFLSSNDYLISGDSDGWLIIWSLSTKRAVAVWKGHDSGVTGIGLWKEDRLITHGRDHKLYVWQIREDVWGSLNTRLPVDGADVKQKKPWLLHSMDVGALNFCTFATCEIIKKEDGRSASSILIAAPNGLDSGGVDVFELPSQKRVSQLRSRKDVNTGMVMAMALFQHSESRDVYLASGYEDGQVMVHRCVGDFIDPPRTEWIRLMAVKAHTQPVLSIDLSRSKTTFFTSSADATLAKFVMTGSESVFGHSMFELDQKTNTKHAGQQGMQVRSDDKILATAGWDSRIRIYSVKTMNELAVLKWHKEGCYAVAFPEIRKSEEDAVASTVPSTTSDLQVRISALDKIKQDRHRRAQQTHWLAAGGKDGKISLWNVY